MIYSSEVTSSEHLQDNVIHQRLLFAYIEASKHIYGNLLELGCGEGRGYALLQERVRGYTGLDKNEKVIANLQVKYPKGHFEVAAIPPLEKQFYEKFDCIVAFQIIEHIAQDSAFLRDIYAALKKGGIAIITTPNKLKSLTRNPWHVREYSPKEMWSLIKTQPFDSAEVIGIHGSAQVMEYYEENKKAVERLTKWDIFNLQYCLPRWVLQYPYEVLNKRNRKHLLDKQEVTQKVHYTDYSLSKELTDALDFFCILRKS